MKALETSKRYGRPAKLLEEQTAETILDAVREGMHVQSAAALAGVSYSTLKGWLQKSRDGAEPYASFAAALLAAEAMSEQDHVKAVSMAGKFGDWRASAWFLERRWAGKRWQQRKELEVQGEVRQKHVVLVDKLERPELEEAEATVASARRPNGESESATSQAELASESQISENGDEPGGGGEARG